MKTLARVSYHRTHESPKTYTPYKIGRRITRLRLRHQMPFTAGRLRPAGGTLKQRWRVNAFQLINLPIIFRMRQLIMNVIQCSPLPVCSAKSRASCQPGQPRVPQIFRQGGFFHQEQGSMESGTGKRGAIRENLPTMDQDYNQRTLPAAHPDGMCVLTSNREYAVQYD